MNEHQTNWDWKLQSALWAYQTFSFKATIDSTLFWLVYGLDMVSLKGFVTNSLWIQVQERLNEDTSVNIRKIKLLKLGEERICCEVVQDVEK